MSELEALSEKIGLIEPFNVLLHRASDEYLVVERKHIPDDTLIIESPVFRFFARALTEFLCRLGGDIRIRGAVHLLNKASGKRWEDFVEIETGSTIQYQDIFAHGYRPALITQIQESGQIFFSRTALDTMKSAGMRFSESPIHHIALFGAA